MYNLCGVNRYGGDQKACEIGLMWMSRIDDLKKETNRLRMINHELKQNINHSIPGSIQSH